VIGFHRRGREARKRWDQQGTYLGPSEQLRADG
jgi:hypothetical protein